MNKVENLLWKYHSTNCTISSEISMLSKQKLQTNPDSNNFILKISFLYLLYFKISLNFNISEQRLMYPVKVLSVSLKYYKYLKKVRKGILGKLICQV